MPQTGERQLHRLRGVTSEWQWRERNMKNKIKRHEKHFGNSADACTPCLTPTHAPASRYVLCVSPVAGLL